MSAGVRIAGMGLVTPLGADLDVVWKRLQQGDVAEVKQVENPETKRLHDYVPVPPKLVEQLGRNPRLRRSSAISYFAVAAGLAAIEQAGITVSPGRTAVIFAVTDGGVAYTRRFYDQIVKQGANAASPMLFPETVYNAPASHLAAQLGIDGSSYTLVGDASTGLAAVKLGEQLLELGEADHVVVVACEEVDWILCEAYADWRLARRPLAEGAAALVLSREGSLRIEVAGGAPFFRQAEAGAALQESLERLPPVEAVDVIVGCANGTFVDAASREATKQWHATASLIEPKRQLGEMLGAGALVQVVLAVQALRERGSGRALVPVIGLNHQADAALVSL
ncbi:MAG: beta-ketoacyl synthase N-terminal-like domain-containing protein [Chthoniobacteraceae bacterium]